MSHTRSYRRHRPITATVKPETAAVQQFLKHSAIIITILAAVTYFHGRALYSGYLSYWGLTPDLFPRASEATMIDGVYVYHLFSFDHWHYILGALAFLPVFYLVLYFLFFEKPFSLIRGLLPKNNTNKLKQVRGEILEELITIVGKIALVILLFLSPFVVSQIASEKGRKIAEVEHRKIAAGDITKVRFKQANIVYRYDNTQQKNASGYLLTNSETLCAFYTDAGVLVLPFSRITSIQFVEQRVQ